MSDLQKALEPFGVSKKMMDEVWAEVQANKALIESCSKPHDFSICLDRKTKQPIENPTPMQRFGAKWKCSKCGGVVDNMHKINYEAGIKDSSKP